MDFMDEIKEWNAKFNRRRRLWCKIRNMMYAFAIAFYIAVIAYAILESIIGG